MTIATNAHNQPVINLTEALITAWNNHNIDRLAALVTPDYEGTDVSESAPHFGPEGIRQSAARYLTAFPDLRLETDLLIIEVDQLALAWTARGTHRGKLMNIPPTGHAIEVRGVSLLTVKENRISRGFYIWDVAGLLRSIGLLPDL